MKITLDTIASGYDLSKINDNFQKIEDDLNNKVLYRDNVDGEINSLQDDIDANSKRIYNLPLPSTNTDAASKLYVDNQMNAGTSNVVAAAQAAASSASTAATAAANSATAAAGYLAPVTATSTTSNTIGTGDKTFTIQTGKLFVPGHSVKVVQTSAPTANTMSGTVVSYNSSTGSIVVNVASVTGSGTLTDWTFSLQSGGSVGVAASVSFTPTGTITATNAQTAIAEVASEAMQKSSNLSDVANVSTSRTNLGLGNMATQTVPTGIVKGDGSSVSAAAAGTDYVAPGSITADGITMNTNKVLGRSTAGVGGVQELALGTGVSVAGGTLSIAISSGDVVTALGYTPANGNLYVSKDMGHNNVGSICFAQVAAAPVGVSAGSTVAGSTLVTAGIKYDSGSGTTALIAGASALSGTWRCLGYLDGTGFPEATLFQRIA